MFRKSRSGYRSHAAAGMMKSEARGRLRWDSAKVVLEARDRAALLQKQCAQGSGNDLRKQGLNKSN